MHTTCFSGHLSCMLAFLSPLPHMPPPRHTQPLPCTPPLPRTSPFTTHRWTESHTDVKTLPSRNFGNKKQRNDLTAYKEFDFLKKCIQKPFQGTPRRAEVARRRLRQRWVQTSQRRRRQLRSGLHDGMDGEYLHAARAYLHPAKANAKAKSLSDVFLPCIMSDRKDQRKFSLSNSHSLSVNAPLRVREVNWDGNNWYHYSAIHKAAGLTFHDLTGTLPSFHRSSLKPSMGEQSRGGGWRGMAGEDSCWRHFWERLLTKELAALWRCCKG